MCTAAQGMSKNVAHVKGAWCCGRDLLVAGLQACRLAQSAKCVLRHSTPQLQQPRLTHDVCVGNTWMRASHSPPAQCIKSPPVAGLSLLCRSFTSSTSLNIVCRNRTCDLFAIHRAATRLPVSHFLRKEPPANRTPKPFRDSRISASTCDLCFGREAYKVSI